MILFTASIQTVIIRYYVMMAVIILTFTLGYPLLTLLGFPIFLSAITAVSFKNKTMKISAKKINFKPEEIKKVNTAA
jgi:hypothetical protein